MDKERLQTLLEQVRAGTVGIDEALRQLRDLPFLDLGYAKLDLHRPLRLGFPEVVYCRGKTQEQVVHIVERLAERTGVVLATKATPEIFQAVLSRVPDAEYSELAQLIRIVRRPAPAQGLVAVATAGTSDLGVAEEAALTAEVVGAQVNRVFDVGVAGLPRLLAKVPELRQAAVVIAVAGMEGALASVLAGLVPVPIIAVPTSTGYGASFGGLAALLGMLNACAPGVTVVNIDNGFGAGYAAALIARGAS